MDNVQLWTELGIDLKKHEQLLNGLGPAFKEIYLSQQNRPRGMGFYDFVVGDIHGIRVHELRNAAVDGRKIVATYCLFVPEEIILAAGAIPVGLCAGAQFSVPIAEETLPVNTCPLIKSSFGFKLGRLCPYVQTSHLIVGETTCDGKKKMFEVLGQHQPVYVMEVPSKKTDRGRRLWAGEVAAFKDKMEELTGNKITAEGLLQATRLVNQRRRSLQRLHGLRTARPAPISGRDALLVTQVAFYDDITRCIQMVNTLADEVELRVNNHEGVASARAPRILVAGSPMAIPNWKLPFIIETSGAVVVAEESCIGSRYFNNLVPEEGGTVEQQLDTIADRYMNIHCACFTPNDERPDDVIKLAREYQVDGVVHYNLQFCQTYANEAIKIRRYLDLEGIPMLNVETDYGTGDSGQLQTRIQAFLEVIKK